VRSSCDGNLAPVQLRRGDRHRRPPDDLRRNLPPHRPPRSGDLITLELPYGTFEYRVFSHEIVDDGDWSIIEPRGFDTLVLPLFSASASRNDLVASGERR
jgi:hypothetical protein